MSNILCGVIRQDLEYKQLADTVSKTLSAKSAPRPILVNGVCDGASDALTVSLIEDVSTSRPALIICADEKDCAALKSTLSRFGLSCGFFVARDLNFYNITASHEFEHDRLAVLSGICDGKFDAVVTTPDAALGFTIPKALLVDNSFAIDFSDEVDISDLALRLVRAGYVRNTVVDGAGQFALRGGIIDVFPPHASFTASDGDAFSGKYPIRIELFGNEIDRMGIFDPESQRFTRSVESVRFSPARELLCDKESLERIKKAIDSRLSSSRDERAIVSLRSERASLDAALAGSGEINFADKYISLIYKETECLLDYFPSERRNFIMIRGTNAVSERLKSAEWHGAREITELLEGGTIDRKYAVYYKDGQVFRNFTSSNVTLHLDSFAAGMGSEKLGGLFGFRTKHTVSYFDKLDLLCDDIKNYATDGYKLILIAENELAAKNLSAILLERGYRSVIESKSDESNDENKLDGRAIYIKWKEYIRGFELLGPRVAVLSTSPDSRSGSFAPQKTSKRGSGSGIKNKNKKNIMSYAELEVGDYVVHESYGIGQYMGVQNITTDGVSRDYISIRYDGSDKLFLPVDKLDRIAKYIGAHSDDDGGSVKLSKLGGDGWNKTKAKAKAAVKDMAKELIALYAERSRLPGHAFPPDDDMQRDFETAFEYDETDSQLDAIDEIKEDMMKPSPMDRLLCGDVGFGKTEVALRAAYKAVLDGKQVALLVPTTILALQHFQTATSRMRPFGVNVDMISRFRSQKQQEATLRKLRRGDIDILIGTHRLISKDVEFSDLGLLIIDEEQRFGVAQKEKLKSVAKNVDVLSLSATPIPRTLNMAMGGIRDISILDEAPGERVPVQTYVLEHDDLIINEAIRRELRRGGQVFYLHNVVDSIDACARRLSKDFPDASIVVAHGKMEKEELEEIWSRMLAGEIDILVCTTIIETGVDIPNANTLIVEGSHRLGLSQLHQIRGRVGRSSRHAYAYFTYPPFRAISEVATKRLETIREYAEFGAGFKIALRDLEIRGAGNLLGSEQHGHLESVGYDLYIKLLNEAVIEERDGKVEEKVDCVVSLGYDAYLPEKYVNSSAERMAIYKKIAMIRNEEDCRDIADELIDRYGEPPKATANLMLIALIKAMAESEGISAIRQEVGGIRFVPTKFDLEVWSEAEEAFKNRIKITMSGEVSVFFRVKSGEDILGLVYKLLGKIGEIKKEK